VLLVEDDADGRELVSTILAAQGAEISAAASVAEGLRMLEERPPDVLLCDIEMPEKDGYQLISAVRRWPAAKGGRVPAAALTAFARMEDRVRALGAGFDMHIPKPVAPQELIVAVHSLYLRAAARREPGSGG
jgi:CheY-like chemotaxis protein